MSRVIYACSDWNGSTCDGDIFNYVYDPAGNLTSFDKWNGSAVETIHYLYNGANQIECIDHNNNGSCQGESEALYQYDAYGNLTDDGTSQYTYDAGNRLVSVTTGSNTTSYTYDGDGNRVSQTVGTTTTTYVNDIATPLTMVLSETSNGQTIHYWQGLDTLAQSDGTNVKYFGYDGLGSVRQLTDSSGAVQLAQTFDPYGNGYSKAGTATSTLGFTGEQTDSNGFVFLRARYYNPSAGRFLNTDPSRLEQNPYLYSKANVVNVTDPSGLRQCDDCDISQASNIASRIANLEAKYQITLIWPYRTDGRMPAIIDVVSGTTCPTPTLGTFQVTDKSGAPTTITPKILYWEENDIDDIDAALGYLTQALPAKYLNITQGGLIIKTDNVGGARAMSCPDISNCQNTQFVGGGYTYALLFAPDWINDTVHGNRRRTVLHETGHHVQFKFVPVSVVQEMYDAFNDDGAPSERSHSSKEEYFTETFARFVFEGANVPAFRIQEAFGDNPGLNSIIDHDYAGSTYPKDDAYGRSLGQFFYDKILGYIP